MWSRSLGRLICRLIQLAHQPLAKRDLGGGSAQGYSAGRVIGEEPPNVRNGPDIGGGLLKTLHGSGMGQEEDMHDVVTGQAVFVGLLGWVFRLVQQPLG